MMPVLGQLLLLSAFVAAGFATFASGVDLFEKRKRVSLQRCTLWSSVVAFLLATGAVGVLVAALVAKDFRFDYVSRYSSHGLHWAYSLSALWVGQAGSLLLWSWLSLFAALVFWIFPRRASRPLKLPAFGVLAAFAFFLLALQVFGANPLSSSPNSSGDGAGLSPLLQHPAMLIHPPVIFAAYAAWAVPFALATSALLLGRLDRNWIDEARPWALFAWAVLGCGILLGANWAYEELGWGGYWGWDPVENGSLLPWLTGTAFIHTLMAWRHRGMMKKTSLALAIGTFALCNFATFLTRSGIFSSLHAFSQSPIGWAFLGLLTLISVGGGWLLAERRLHLTSDRPFPCLLCREAMVALSGTALLVLASATFLGTLAVPLSNAFTGAPAVVGPSFYASVLAPTGLAILACTGAAPLLRWGTSPSDAERRCLQYCIAAGVVAALGLFAAGIRKPFPLTVYGVVAFAAFALAACLALDVQRRRETSWPTRIGAALEAGHPKYSGFVVHLGLFMAAIGVTSSSYGNARREIDLAISESVDWEGRTVSLVDLVETKLPGKLIAEAILEVRAPGRQPIRMAPAQHFHRLQDEWTTEVAIHSTFIDDVYVILHGSAGDRRASLTLVRNPGLRWLWLGGGVMAMGAALGSWPRRRSARVLLLRPEIDGVGSHIGNQASSKEARPRAA